MAAEGGRARDYSGGVTFSVAVTGLMAASCGLIFGYDIGVSGALSLLARGGLIRSSLEMFAYIYLLADDLLVTKVDPVICVSRC
jgi:hypothetical protein